MRGIIQLYHGSPDIIRKPEYGIGNTHNDFGLGFYCTESKELAKEWACTSLNGGFSNHYALDMNYLSVLNINSEDYTILNWIAVLVSNRFFRAGSPNAGRAMRYLTEEFGLNVNAYDIIKGYRADDAYYDFADAFLNNAITVNQLAAAMKLGSLGEQIVIKAKRAFDNLSFLDYETADGSIYYQSRKNRMDEAQRDYYSILEKDDDGLYMSDIMKGKIKNEDPRIPRNIP